MGLTQKLGTIPLAILTDASNNVGIGAAPSGSYKLEVTGTAKVSSTLLVSGQTTFTSANNGKIFSSTGATTGYQYAEIINTGGNLNIAVASSTGTIWGSGNGGAYNGTIGTANTTDFVLATDNTGRMIIKSTGTIGINMTPTGDQLSVTGTAANWAGSFWANTTSGSSYGAIVRGGTTTGDVAFRVNNAANNTTYFSIRGDGNTNLGSITPDYKLTINSGASESTLGLTSNNGVKIDMVGYGSAFTYPQARIQLTDAGLYGGFLSFWTKPNGASANALAERIRINDSGKFIFPYTTANVCIYALTNDTLKIATLLTGLGNLSVEGVLSAGTKPFLIQHPLPNLKETHNLRHISVESPQADLIYRGKLTLVNGKAEANIDEVSTMTNGTFEALCREVQCFTTNESGWDLVKGKVIGNIIYIESQNTNSADEISWMVIGERKDEFMMNTDITYDNGKVIVEPLKSIQELNERLNKAGL